MFDDAAHDFVLFEGVQIVIGLDGFEFALDHVPDRAHVCDVGIGAKREKGAQFARQLHVVIAQVVKHLAKLVAFAVDVFLVVVRNDHLADHRLQLLRHRVQLLRGDLLRRHVQHVAGGESDHSFAIGGQLSQLSANRFHRHPVLLVVDDELERREFFDESLRLAQVLGVTGLVFVGACQQEKAEHIAGRLDLDFEVLRMQHHRLDFFGDVADAPVQFAENPKRRDRNK